MVPRDWAGLGREQPITPRPCLATTRTPAQRGRKNYEALLPKTLTCLSCQNSMEFGIILASNMKDEKHLYFWLEIFLDFGMCVDI